MAGSRLANFGTIFERATGLLRSGALKEKPLWYDIYIKYPPLEEPKSDRPLPPQDPITELVYEEDFERVKLSRNIYKSQKTTRVKSRVRLPTAGFVKDISQD